MEEPLLVTRVGRRGPGWGSPASWLAARQGGVAALGCARLVGPRGLLGRMAAGFGRRQRVLRARAGGPRPEEGVAAGRPPEGGARPLGVLAAPGRGFGMATGMVWKGETGGLTGDEERPEQRGRRCRPWSPRRNFGNRRCSGSVWRWGTKRDSRRRKLLRGKEAEKDAEGSGLGLAAEPVEVLVPESSDDKATSEQSAAQATPKSSRAGPSHRTEANRWI